MSLTCFQDAWDNYIQSGGLDLASQNWPALDPQQLQQAPQTSMPPRTSTMERPAYQPVTSPPNIFLPNGVPPGGGIVLNNDIRFQGPRPGQG